jgi:hypothetical protein
VGLRVKRHAAWLHDLANPWIMVRAINDTFKTTYRPEELDDVPGDQLEAALAVANYLYDLMAPKKGKKGKH